MKHKTYRDILYVFREEIRENPKGLFIQALDGIIIGLRGIPLMVFPSLIINAVLGQKMPEEIIALVMVFAFLVFLAELAGSFSGQWAEEAGARFAHPFILKLAKKLVVVDYSELDNTESANHYDNAVNMCFKFCETPAHLTRTVISCILEVASLAYILVTLDIWVMLGFVFMAVVMRMAELHLSKIEKRFDEERVLLRRKQNYAQELMFSRDFAKDCRAYDAVSFVNRKYREASVELLAMEKKWQMICFRWEAFQAAAGFVQTLFLYGFMIAKYMVGDISIGSFSMYIAAANQVFHAITNITLIFESTRDFSLYYKDYEDYMALPEMMRQGVKPESPEVTGAVHEIEFREVSFRYPSRTEYALRDVNLTIRPSEHIAVVGENGAGKTTFVKLLLRLYDVTEGQILLNGRDIREYPYDEYMKLFSTVFQDYKIFACSVEENIAFKDIDRERVREAMKKAGVYECVEKLPNKGQTIMMKEFESSGVELSGGERQKVAIARAIYKDAPVAILDEPTAALDPLAEYEIYSNFNRFADEKICIYISHRMSSSKFCDRILVFSQGKIEESGSHRELMEKQGLYYNMYQMQASYYQEDREDERAEYTAG